MYKRSQDKKDANSITPQNAVASLYEIKQTRKELWQEAIKWPLYSIAVMPVVLAAAWTFAENQGIRVGHFLGFLIASIALLLWENLTNDLFDSETGVDKINKPHSVVALVGGKDPIRKLAFVSLLTGLLIIYILGLTSNKNVFFLVLGSCLLGYLYQGPPFRLGYQGLGEPLCWIAFGPLATAAALLVLAPAANITETVEIPWRTALIVGTGPAIATTLVLFCSHFHQVKEDAANGKKSPLVRLGTRKASSLIPWLISMTLACEWIPIIKGDLPLSACLGIIGLPPAISLIKLLKKHHNQPSLTKKSKFLALRFQALNGFGFSLGIALSSFLKVN